MATGTAAGGGRKHVVKMLTCCEKVATLGFTPNGGEISLREAKKVAAKNRRLLASIRPLPQGHSRSSKE